MVFPRASAEAWTSTHVTPPGQSWDLPLLDGCSSCVAFFLPARQVLLPTSRANLPPRIFQDVTSISIIMYQKAYHSRINCRVGCDGLKASFVRILSKFISTVFFATISPGHCKTWLTCFASHLYICKSIHSHYFPLWIHEHRKVNLEDQCPFLQCPDKTLRLSVLCLLSLAVCFFGYRIYKHLGAEQRSLFVVVRFPGFFSSFEGLQPTLAWLNSLFKLLISTWTIWRERERYCTRKNPTKVACDCNVGGVRMASISILPRSKLSMLRASFSQPRPFVANANFCHCSKATKTTFQT